MSFIQGGGSTRRGRKQGRRGRAASSSSPRRRGRHGGLAFRGEDKGEVGQWQRARSRGDGKNRSAGGRLARALRPKAWLRWRDGGVCEVTAAQILVQGGETQGAVRTHRAWSRRAEWSGVGWLGRVRAGTGSVTCVCVWHGMAVSRRRRGCIPGGRRRACGEAIVGP